MLAKIGKSPGQPTENAEFPCLKIKQRPPFMRDICHGSRFQWVCAARKRRFVTRTQERDERHCAASGCSGIDARLPARGAHAHGRSRSCAVQCTLSRKEGHNDQSSGRSGSGFLVLGAPWPAGRLPIAAVAFHPRRSVRPRRRGRATAGRVFPARASRRRLAAAALMAARQSAPSSAPKRAQSNCGPGSVLRDGAISLCPTISEIG